MDMTSKDRSILFLAMSGVRVRDEELRKLGMTLPGFVERSQVIASLPSLSLLTLASFTPEHWEITYAEVDDLDGFSTAMFATFDVVAISALTARIIEAYKLALEFRRLGSMVVLGGLHVSALPDEALQFGDSIVIGEGESVWEHLLSDFEIGHLRRVYSQADFGTRTFNFHHSRVPRYDLLDVSKYNRITLQTSR